MWVVCGWVMCVCVFVPTFLKPAMSALNVHSRLIGQFHTKHKVSLVTSLSETSATQQGIQDYEAILLLMNALKV